MNHPLNIILLGAPGSGKGTQAEKLTRDLHIPHISTGTILRNTPDPAIQALLREGKLVPDAEVLRIVEHYLSQQTRGWILDGMPRTLTQAKALAHIPLKVIYLNADDATVKQRLAMRRTCSHCGAIYHLINHPPAKESTCDLCGGLLIQRNDDRLDVIEARLKTYHELTAPLIDYYRAKHQLIEIPALQSPDETHN